MCPLQTQINHIIGNMVCKWTKVDKGFFFWNMECSKIQKYDQVKITSPYTKRELQCMKNTEVDNIAVALAPVIF